MLLFYKSQYGSDLINVRYQSEFLAMARMNRRKETTEECQPKAEREQHNVELAKRIDLVVKRCWQQEQFGYKKYVHVKSCWYNGRERGTSKICLGTRSVCSPEASFYVKAAYIFCLCSDSLTHGVCVCQCNDLLQNHI